MYLGLQRSCGGLPGGEQGTWLATIHKKALGGVRLVLFEKEFKKNLIAAEGNVLDEVGKRWLEFFLSRCPVDTGFMVSQGEYRIEEDGDQAVILQAGVGDQVEYATIVEERTHCIDSSMNDAMSELKAIMAKPVKKARRKSSKRKAHFRAAAKKRKAALKAAGR